MFLILVNALYRSATLFIISSYLGRSNSSEYSTSITPSLNCTITMPKGEEPKPGSMPSRFLCVLYWLLLNLSLHTDRSFWWRPCGTCCLSIPDIVSLYSLPNGRLLWLVYLFLVRKSLGVDTIAIIWVRLSDIALNYKPNVFLFRLTKEITFV